MITLIDMILRSEGSSKYWFNNNEIEKEVAPTRLGVLPGAREGLMVGKHVQA